MLSRKFTYNPMAWSDWMMQNKYKDLIIQFDKFLWEEERVETKSRGWDRYRINESRETNLLHFVFGTNYGMSTDAFSMTESGVVSISTLNGHIYISNYTIFGVNEKNYDQQSLETKRHLCTIRDWDHWITPTIQKFKNLYLDDASPSYLLFPTEEWIKSHVSRVKTDKSPLGIPQGTYYVAVNLTTGDIISRKSLIMEPMDLQMIAIDPTRDWSKIKGHINTCQKLDMVVDKFEKDKDLFERCCKR